MVQAAGAAYENMKGKMDDRRLKYATEIVRTMLAFSQGTMTGKEAAEHLRKTVGGEVVRYMKAFAAKKLDELVRSCSEEQFREKAGDDLGKRMVKNSEAVAEVIWQWLQGDFGPEELPARLAESGVKQMAVDLYLVFRIAAPAQSDALKKAVRSAVDAAKAGGAAGVDLTFALPAGGEAAILTAAYAATAVAALVPVYLIVSHELSEADLARERRLAAEAQRDEVVALIAAERAEMETAVRAYLSEHLTVIEEGFADMDAAFVAQDPDGFIRANARLQQLLGYEQQYASQEEFDDLMLSDEAFRL